ncbi:MAG: hypothetical protein NTW21_19095 [Verrucomicrobia bacterium]|nr:hypothetical protein [Verrucomicrobiota bacterium]
MRGMRGWRKSWDGFLQKQINPAKGKFQIFFVLRLDDFENGPLDMAQQRTRRFVFP